MSPELDSLMATVAEQKAANRAHASSAVLCVPTSAACRTSGRAQDVEWAS
jgi:hypothetical protein